MIDIKELRVGSHILVDGEISEIYGISHKGCTIRFDDSPFGCAFLTEHNKVEPIPITVELLTNLGFKPYEDENYLILSKRFKQYKFDIMLHNEHWNVATCNSVCLASHKIKYLHELECFVYMTLHEELIKDEL